MFSKRVVVGVIQEKEDEYDNELLIMLEESSSSTPS
jgi:hypothetical protein